MRCIWSAIQNQDITMSDPKSWFPSSICRFLAWLFYTWSASLSSTRYPWHLLFPTFFREFLPKCQQGFAWNCHNFPPPLTKKKVTGNRFVLLWGRSAKFFRSEIAKLSWENAGKYPRDYSWTSSHCTKGLCRCTELITFQGGHSLDHLIGSRNKEHSYAAIAVLSDRIGYDRME